MSYKNFTRIIQDQGLQFLLATIQEMIMDILMHILLKISIDNF